jgi:hypothetical protein
MFISKITNDLIINNFLSYIDEDLTHIMIINKNFMRCVKKYLNRYYNVEYIQDKSCGMCKKNIMSKDNHMFPLPTEITRVKAMIRLYKLYGDLSNVDEKKIVCHKCEKKFNETQRYVPKDVYSSISDLISSLDEKEKENENENIIHINNSFFVFISKHTILKKIYYQYLTSKPSTNIFF